MSPTEVGALPSLVLASRSPRRRELLGTLGLEFEVRPPNVPESPHPGETPEGYVRRLSREKAAAVGTAGELVIAADTIVVVDDEVLEKPVDNAEAASMLHRLQGREHRVLTGVSVRDVSAAGLVTDHGESLVHMRPMIDDEITWYVATGEPADKAGSYALQGIGAIFVAGAGRVRPWDTLRAR